MSSTLTMGDTNQWVYKEQDGGKIELRDKYMFLNVGRLAPKKGCRLLLDWKDTSSISRDINKALIVLKKVVVSAIVHIWSQDLDKLLPSIISPIKI